MGTGHLLIATCLAAVAPTAWAADNPFAQFKGKMKEGLYEYKIEMDMGQMPGMPAGMGKQNTSLQRCVTAEDIEKGRMARSERDPKMAEDCEIKNFKMSGNSASYTMECKGAHPMTADNNITFTSDGYKLDTRMAMNQGGRALNMTQQVDTRYLGPCNK
jgi:hypothetical protein